MRDSASQQADNVWLVVCCCHLTRGSHSGHQHCPTKLELSKTRELSNLGKATQVFCKGQWGTTTTPPWPPKKLWVALRERGRLGWLVVQSPVARRFNFNSTKTGFVSDPVVLRLTAVWVLYYIHEEIDQCVWVCMYVCACTCVWSILMCTRACTHTHTHTHIHFLSLSLTHTHTHHHHLTITHNDIQHTVHSTHTYHTGTHILSLSWYIQKTQNITENSGLEWPVFKLQVFGTIILIV